MKISIITLFPQIFEPIFRTSIMDRARDKGFAEYELINLRDFGEGVHKSVDGRPYGGGPGMILRADILAKALDSIPKTKQSLPLRGKRQRQLTILTSPTGQTLNQSKARELSQFDHLIIICGHYEGVDQRFIDKYVDLELSIGDYVLTGGELPAMVIADAVVRLLPGVLKKEEATIQESFEEGLLEYPQYTRPDKFKDSGVPEVLKSGNHQEISKWREQKSRELTQARRPDLLPDH